MSAQIVPFKRPELAAPETQKPSEPDNSPTPTLRVLSIHNPLLPMASRQESLWTWEPCKTMAEYVSERIGAAGADLAISLNGRVLTPEQREHVVPRAGDCVVIAPRVHGGSVWRTLAMVAVMVASIALPAFLIGSVAAWSFAGSTLVASLIGGAIAIGGNLLINALMPLTPSTKAQAPSWAFNGPQTLAQPGVGIPKGAGTFRSPGNVIASFVDIEGSDQYINALVCYGFGPARAITDIEINGKSIGNYQNVQYYLRMGSNNQTAIPAFNRIVNGYPQQTQVTVASGPVVVPGTGDLTQALQVDVQFATGVYYMSGAGNQLPCKVVYKVEYAPSGTSSWNPVLQPRTTQDVVIYHSDGTVDTSATPKWGLVWTECAPGSGILLDTDNGPHTPGDPQTHTETITTYNANGSSQSYSHTFQGEWQPIDTSLNQIKVLDWMEGWIQYVNDTTQAVYNRTSIYGLAPGKYDVRVTKWGSNNADNTVTEGDYDSPKRGQEVWIHSINEITYQDLSYPNMILVGVRALATNQLSGADINITALITYGLRTLDNNLLPAALQAYEEDNPACVAADILLDPLYGGGQGCQITPSNIERFIDEWVAWANLNDTLVPDGNGNNIRLHVYNGIFDSESDLWTQVQTVARMSRASIIPMGRDYGVFVHQADTPVQIFSVGNILRDSFEETFLNLDERANQIEVEIADATRYYKTDNPIVYMDPADQAAGVVVKPTRIKGSGITLPAQAWHYGHFLGLCNKNILRTGKIQSDVDAVACRAGNLIILQHDVPEWGWGGRTLPGATASSLPVDRNDLPWDGTTAYNVIVLFPSIVRYTGVINSATVSVDGTGAVVGTLLTLSSFDALNRVTRAVINGNDCPILSMSAGQILITTPPGFVPTVGQAYTLYDTDVMETATVTGVTPGPNNTSVLALGTPFTQAPEDFSVYFYGQPGSQKIVRVSDIKRTGVDKLTIEWMDEDDAIYAIGTPVVGETSAQVTTSPGVKDLTASEVFELQQGTYLDFASLTWKNGTNTEGVAIYGTYPGLAAPKMLTRLTGRATQWKYQIAPGVQWTFRVVGFDANDNYAAYATAPTVTITGLGVTANLLLDSSFQSGYAYWNVSTRAGDTQAASLDDAGESVYTVAGSTFTTPQTLLSQVVSASKWSVGTLLMLSAYFRTVGTPTGNLIAEIAFFDGTGTVLSTATATLAMAGSAAGLTRVWTALTAVPSGTVQVAVRVRAEGSSLSLPAGTVLAVSHLLLEIGDSGQTVPSVWADIDVQGNVLDVFQSGSSSGLRTQASTLPVATGSITYATTPTTAALSWTNLVIAWPDGGYTYVQDGSLPAVSGLTASTTYYAFLYWDVVAAMIVAVAPASAVGTPPTFGTAYDPAADHACRLDGRVALAPGGLQFTTPASGSGGGTGGGGGGGGGYGPIPPPVGGNPN